MTKEWQNGNRFDLGITASLAGASASRFFACQIPQDEREVDCGLRPPARIFFEAATNPAIELRWNG